MSIRAPPYKKNVEYSKREIEWEVKKAEYLERIHKLLMEECEVELEALKGPSWFRLVQVLCE